MRRLVWGAEARADLRDILSYIAARDLAAADRLLTRIERVASTIAARLFAFRPGRVEGTREAVAHPNYLIVYEVGAVEIRILAILHARRRYPLIR